MRFSCWNYGTRQYDYYDAGDFPGTHVTKGQVAAFGISELGATPEQFATPLPTNAAKAGSGDVAQGVISSKRSLLTSLPRWLVYGVIAYAVWRMTE